MKVSTNKSPTVDDAGEGAGSQTAKYTHTVDGSILGNTVSVAADGTGAVSSVAVAVIALSRHNTKHGENRVVEE